MTTETEIIKFASIDEMIEAKAQEQHQANLNYGGVFDAAGNRFSDIKIERRVAIQKGTTYVHADHANAVLGKELSSSAFCARYIQNFGYVEFN